MRSRTPSVRKRFPVRDGVTVIIGLHDMAKRPQTLTEETLKLLWYIRARERVSPYMRLMGERLFVQFTALKKEEDRERIMKKRFAPMEPGKRRLVLEKETSNV